MGMPPTDCSVLYNMVAGSNGLRVRLGSREWVSDLDAAGRTLIPYAGSASDETRVFVTTPTGIWNATESDATPAQDEVFGSSAGDAGYGVAHAHTTAAGNFLFYADEENGLLLYTESTGLWTVPAITGVDPADIVFVTVFKGFPFFAVRDSTDLWFLDVGTVGGAASRLGVGYKLQAGGSIVGMWSWSYDGGSGLDDSLVVVSSGGDVVIYQGTDPTDPILFGVRGVWGVGKMPAGRNLALAFGGDLLLLTRLGTLPMSQLVSGRTLNSVEYQTDKIRNLFNELMVTRGDMRGWSMCLHPEEGGLLVTVPDTGDGAQQLFMSMAGKSWSILRGLDMACAASHDGKLYFADSEGSVHINDGHVDGRPLSDPNDYSAIDYSLITAFQNFGTGQKKRMLLIRPHFVGQAAAPSFRVGARYDFNTTELDAVALSAGSSGSWDVGLWDTMLWGGANAPTHALRGASGMGSNVAIALRGASVDRVALVGFEVSFAVAGRM
jgi:hypothetical protein